jgi:hypothetical protein
MTTKSGEQELIRQVVRGERPWKDLGAIGIKIDFEGDRCAIENERGIVATADVHDLAEGLLAHVHGVHEVRKWAYLMEAGSSFLDLDVEDHPAGEVLLNALWDASFGQPIPAEAIAAAERLVRRKQTPV